MEAPGADVSTTPLLERDRDTERLDAQLSIVMAGSSTLVVIEGPAGIGKTALVDTTAVRAARAGMTVARARASELERDLAFGVVRQLLDPLVIGADEAARKELFAGAASAAKSLFDADADVARQESSSEPDAEIVLRGLYWLCSAIAQQRPAALLIDDAHWADHASLRFLVYLAQRLEGMPLAVVVATRLGETPAEEEFLVRLATAPGATVIAPQPLSEGAIAALLASELDTDPESAFVEQCRAATGGTPFLIRELIRELRDQSIPPTARSIERVGDLRPRAIARTVIARARRIDPAALAIVRAVAVLGANADPRRVAWLAKVDGQVAPRVLDLLAHAGLIGSGRPLEFTHPILSSAIYGEIPAGERSELHARAAELLRREGLADERIASHLLAADPMADPDTVELLARTAQAALARGAPTSAVSYLRRALVEPPAAADRASLLAQLGEAEIRAGELEAARQHLEEAHRLAEPALRVRCGRDLAAAFSIQGRYAEAADAIGKLLDERRSLDRDLALALSGELLLLALFEPALRSDAERRLAEIDTDLGGRSPGARTYLSARTLDATLAVRPATEIRNLGARARDAGLAAELASGVIAWPQVVFPLIFADDFELAELMVSDALEELSRRASVVGFGRVYTARSFLNLRRGELPDALADARIAADAALEAGYIGRPIALSALVDALVERGEQSAAADALEEAGMSAEIPENFLHSWVVASRARLRLAQGEVDAAIADFEELGRRADHFNQANPATVGHRAGLATALLRRGEAERARALAEEELELSRAWGAPRTLGISLRTLGLCSAGDRHVELLWESTQVLEGSGARLEHARSLIELGAAIRRGGMRSEAREPLHAGMELAHTCGAPPLAERAREELLSTGARPRRVMRTGVDALTPSELRVARMAAEGMTNREIAQALFVTARTVEGHLTHAFQKLEIASRRELPSRLAD